MLLHPRREKKNKIKQPIYLPMKKNVTCFIFTSLKDKRQLINISKYLTGNKVLSNGSHGVVILSIGFETKLTGAKSDSTYQLFNL